MDSEETLMAKKLKISQVRSVIGSQRKKHRVVMQSLGFRKIHQTLYKNDSPEIRGMLNKVRHLIEWEEVDEKDIPGPAPRKAGFTVIERGTVAEDTAQTGAVEALEDSGSQGGRNAT